MEHNRSGYQQGCRCTICKDANTQYQHDYRHGLLRGRSNGQKPPPDIVHGTRNAYVHRKCRCDQCVEANRTYQREYMRLRRQGVAMNDPMIDAVLAPVVNAKGKALRRKSPGM